MKLRPLNALVMLLAVVATAIGVVYSKHMDRELFIELQALGNERDRMDVEWGRLQLEQSTLTTQGQVERAALNKLGMVNLSATRMVIVRP